MEKKISHSKKKKTAVVFGSSGLVGGSLVRALSENSDYKEIVCFNRKSQNFDFAGCTEIIDDLTDIETISSKIKGHEVYCCLGSTIKKAGSKAEFSRIDFDLPVEIGKACAKNGVNHYLVVSSIGANAGSGNFYLRTKGLMEQAILALSVPQITIVRPSMLLGKRNEVRPAEQAGKVLMKLLSPLIPKKWKKYKAIHADVVARALLIIGNSSASNQKIFESHHLQEIVDGED